MLRFPAHKQPLLQHLSCFRGRHRHRRLSSSSSSCSSISRRTSTTATIRPSQLPQAVASISMEVRISTLFLLEPTHTFMCWPQGYLYHQYLGGWNQHQHSQASRPQQAAAPATAVALPQPAPSTQQQQQQPTTSNNDTETKTATVSCIKDVQTRPPYPYSPGAHGFRSLQIIAQRNMLGLRPGVGGASASCTPARKGQNRERKPVPPVHGCTLDKETECQEPQDVKKIALSTGTNRPQRSQLSDERKSLVRSPPSPELCVEALGLVVVSGLTKAGWLEGTCLELSRLCREGRPWAVRVRAWEMPPRLPFGRANMQAPPENRLARRLLIKRMVIVKGACINKEGFTWPTGVEKLRFEPFQVNLVGAKWPPTVAEIKLCSGTTEPTKKCRQKKSPSVNGVVWPESLRRLELLQRNFNTPLQDMVFPDGLQHIVLGGTFNQPIARVVWPSQLVRIVFSSESFRQPIDGVQWPAALQHLSLGGCFHQPIAGVQWPPDLRVLKFSREFDQPLDGVVWPNALRELHFLTGEFGDGYFDQPIDVTPLPRTLEVLKFGSMFNRSIDNIEWPATLREIAFGSSFNGGDSMLAPSFTGGGSANLRSVVWPASLRDFTAPVAKLAEKLACDNSRRSYSRRRQRRQHFRKMRKMHHDDCTLCAGRREKRRIDEFRHLDWVPKDCRIHDAYSPIKQEDGLRYYDDSCTENENSSDDEEERKMREAMRYCVGWGY